MQFLNRRDELRKFNVMAPLIGTRSACLPQKCYRARQRLPVGRPDERDPARRPSAVPGGLQQSGGEALEIETEQ